MNTWKFRRRITALVLAAAMICIPAAGTVHAGTADPSIIHTQTEDQLKKSTTVTGLLTKGSWSPSKYQLTDTITVKNPGGRTIELQRYSPAAGKWQLTAVFETKDEAQSRVVITYPEIWKKYSRTTWRLVIAGNDEYEGYISSSVHIQLCNREKVPVTAECAMIYDATSGQMVYSKNAFRKHAMASTTKLMTSLLAAENCGSFEKVRISDNARLTPYPKLRYSRNDTVYVKSLLAACLLPSDNGSAVALAEHVSGTQKSFVSLMNRRAQQLGCTDTHFVNAHGLDAAGHYSTARDIAVIAAAALKKPVIRDLASRRTYTFRTLGYGISMKCVSSNRLLGTPGVIGLKTGTTDAAGYCFAGAYAYKGRTYITVVFDSATDSARFTDTQKLFRYIRKYG